MIEHVTGRLTFGGLADTSVSTVTKAFEGVSSVDSMVLDHDSTADDPWVGYFRTTRPIARDVRARRAVMEDFTVALNDAGLGDATGVLVDAVEDSTGPFMHDDELAKKLASGDDQVLATAKKADPADKAPEAKAEKPVIVKSEIAKPVVAADDDDDYDEDALPNSSRAGSKVSTS